MSILPIKEQQIKKLLVIFYLVEIAGFLWPLTHSFFVTLIPFTLLVNLGLIFLYQKGWSTNLFLAFFFIAVAGFGLEWLATQSGLIFGHYHYTSVLGYRISGTPIITSANWLILVLGVFYLLKALKFKTWLISLIGAFLMTGYDWIMEPVAIRLHMWQWETLHIPMQNYIAWFFISFLFLYFFGQASNSTRNKIAGFVFLTQLFFFMILRLAILLKLL